VEYAQQLLEQIGLQGRRVQMINLSSAMGGSFAEATTEMTEKIAELGLNPLKCPVKSDPRIPTNEHE
jgi:coenzyme F420-reducing hydrogenase delta subunit